MSRETIVLIGTWITSTLFNSLIQTNRSFQDAAPLIRPAIGFAVASGALAILFFANRRKVLRLETLNERVEFAIRPAKALYYGLFIFLALTGTKALALLANGDLDQSFGQGLGNLPITSIVIGIYLTAYRPPAE